MLRSGGEYEPCHVERLRRQVLEFAPEADFICLSDTDCTDRVPLAHNWPGWWSKMESCRPDIVGDGLLLMDLDTTIVGPLDDILARRELTVLSDFYWTDKIQSSLMYITPAAAEPAWAAFTTDPAKHMRECVTRERWGDQGFLEGVWSRNVARWQDVLPSACVSYKVHVRRAQNRREHGNGTVPKGARVIISHGLPRPWEVGL